MKNITESGLSDPSAVALGLFDGLHLGHTEVIKKTLNREGLSSVIFTFNDKTKLPKFQQDMGNLIISYERKTELFEKTGADYIFAPDFGDLCDYSVRDFVGGVLKERLSAAYVVCGYDFHFAKGGEGNPEILKELCREYGIECEVVPPVKLDGEIISSTEIRELIKSGNIEKANRFLGYELSYSLKVVRGSEIGRKIGFPTINQFIPEEMVCPKNGVYKSRVTLGGKSYRGITNIGVKPTVGYRGRPVMETHIIGYSEDLYGKTVTVSLTGYLREEEKFSSLEELKAQLTCDKSIV